MKFSAVIQLPSGSYAVRYPNGNFHMFNVNGGPLPFAICEGDEIYKLAYSTELEPVKVKAEVKVGFKWKVGVYDREVVALETNDHGTYAFVKESFVPGGFAAAPSGNQVRSLYMNVNNIPVSEVEKGIEYAVKKW
jgi:hypothetical protein